MDPNFLLVLILYFGYVKVKLLTYPSLAILNVIDEQLKGLIFYQSLALVPKAIDAVRRAHSPFFKAEFFYSGHAVVWEELIKGK